MFNKEGCVLNYSKFEKEESFALTLEEENFEQQKFRDAYINSITNNLMKLNFSQDELAFSLDSIKLCFNLINVNDLI